MLTVFRDDAKRWLIGIVASGLLLGVMGWSATQPTLHYRLVTGCTGYGTGSSQSDCQTHSGAVSAAANPVTAADPATGTAVAHPATGTTVGLPNTGQNDLLIYAMLGIELVLIGAFLALWRRRNKSHIS